MLELDILLQSFVKDRYDQLDRRGQKAFETMLEYPDAELLELLMGRASPRDAEILNVIKTIRPTASD